MTAADMEYNLLLYDGQHTSWVSNGLLVSMGYASVLGRHYAEEQDGQDDIPEADYWCWDNEATSEDIHDDDQEEQDHMEDFFSEVACGLEAT